MIEQWYRKVVLPGYETLIKRRGTFRHLRSLDESQWWSHDQITKLQIARLRSFLKTCHRDVPWYRQRWDDHGLDVNDVHSFEDLARFPITTRTTLREHAASFRSTDSRLKTVSKATGGSTGIPLRFVIEEQANDRRVAATFRGYGWAGGGPGTKQSYLWGVPLGKQSLRHAWKERCYNRILYRRDMLNNFELSESNAVNYVRRINRHRPDVLVAYANALYLLAKMAERQGLSIRPPRGIVVGAEKLHGFQRTLIENVFGAPVFETYGSREFTLIGAECERHDGLHISAENLIVEIVDDDGKPTNTGEEGHILVTDFFNTAMPFVRYAIGDRGIAGFPTCPCGRGLPLLRQVVGRQAETLRLPDGRELSGLYFPHLMKDYSSIAQFQVVQSRPDFIELRLKVDDHWDEKQLASLRQELDNRLSHSTQWTLHFVDRIELTSAGKTRVVIAYDAEIDLNQERALRAAG